jgi:hypothetical protein
MSESDLVEMRLLAWAMFNFAPAKPSSEQFDESEGESYK